MDNKYKHTEETIKIFNKVLNDYIVYVMMGKYQ